VSAPAAVHVAHVLEQTTPRRSWASHGRMTDLPPDLPEHVRAFLAVAGSPPRPWSTLTAQQARAQHLASRTPDTTAPAVPTADHSAARPDGTRLALRTYGEGDGAVLVFLHGGGWVYGDLDMADGLCRRLTAALEVRVCSVDYRLSPEHRFPLALDDACLAVGWAVDELSGGRPLGIVGSSAGGNLAIAATLVDRDSGAGRIALHVPMCPVTDHAFDTPSYVQGPAGAFLDAADMRWYWAQYLADPADGDNPLASVLRADLHGMPPALVVTAGLDVLRDEGEAYAHALAAAGSEVRLARFEHMVHAFPTLSAFAVEQGEVIELIGDAVEVLR
jgi:acetyl esterase